MSLRIFELGRELQNRVKRPVIDLYALDQSHFIPCQDRGAAESFAFPFEVCLRSIDGFMRESQCVVHASGRGRENGRNGFDADARPAHNGGIEHRVRSEGGSEFRHSNFLDNTEPVFAWFAR
jgi:hypothetical protein